MTLLNRDEREENWLVQLYSRETRTVQMANRMASGSDRDDNNNAQFPLLIKSVKREREEPRGVDTDAHASPPQRRRASRTPGHARQHDVTGTIDTAIPSLAAKFTHATLLLAHVCPGAYANILSFACAQHNKQRERAGSSGRGVAVPLSEVVSSTYCTRMVFGAALLLHSVQCTVQVGSQSRMVTKVSTTRIPTRRRRRDRRLSG